MMVALGFFLLGRKKYRRVPPQGNVVAKVCKIIYVAIQENRRHPREQHQHWLDSAIGTILSHK